jgi:archaellum component FlaC
MAAYRGKRPFGELGKVAPTLVTTLGVLGTFVGIYLGLINFNTSNIDVSIPLLLEGLKTAFITSIFGMAAYLALNFVYKRYDGKEASAEDANSEDPVVLLRKIAAELAGLTTETKASRLGIAKCITSDDDASMKSQLKLVRDDLNTFKQEVATGFDAFSVKVGQQMGDAMVNGLREIVDQFHARLNEMIGAEFRQLKDAMLKLVEWQENYRISVDAMQAQLKTCMEQVNSASGLLVGTSDATRAAGEQLDRIKGSLSGITTSTQDIAQHLESLKLQNAQLATLIQGVRIIGEEAKTVLPSIAEHLNGTTRVLQDSAGATGQQLVQATTALKTAVEGAIATMNESSLRHSRQVDAYLEKLESNLQETLTESLDVLVVKLASLSSRFAEDYTPLANKLREIVQIAEGVNGYQSTGVAQ